MSTKSANIKVAVAGSRGRMGQEIVALINQDPSLLLAARMDRPKENENEIKNEKTKIDVLIDFSVKEAVLEHIRYCETHQIPMVVGVTDLEKNVLDQLKETSRKIPIVYSPNMSIGINIGFKILAILSEFTNNQENSQAEFAIHEIHHKNKKDAPSGTALKMAEVIKNANDIPISSLRIGEVPGEHSVLFSLPGEQLEIVHKAYHRSIFAKGAVLAAKWVHNQKPGLYDMQDVLW